MSRFPERRLRFSVEQDIQLLKEVIRENPFEDVERWKEVHENFVNECNVPFSLRTCKDHCNHLLNLYLKDALKARPKESPEDFSKKQKYLDQILEMRKQYTAVNSTPRRGPRSSKCEDSDNEQPLSVKKEESDTQKEDSDDDFFWEEENERDKKEKERDASDIETKLKRQELALEEREIALKEKWTKLEEERFELDRLEKIRRMEIEKAERDMYRKVVVQNQRIINTLMDLYNKRNGGNLCIL